MVLCCTSISADSADSYKNIKAENSAVAAASSVGGVVRKEQRSLPDSPAAKAPGAMDSEDAASGSSSAENVSPVQPFFPSPVRAAGRTSLETPRERNAWYALVVAGHGTAVFDAYTTRRAISGNYGSEGNPLLRPFSHSNAIYAATQVSPAIMDYLGHRMMRSHNTLIRRFWWVPQAAGASFSVSAGVHNYRLVQ